MELISLSRDKVFNLERLCAIMPRNVTQGSEGDYYAVFDGSEDGWIRISPADRREILLRYTATGKPL